MFRLPNLLIVVVFLTIVLPVRVWAQDEVRLDTSRVYELDAVVVTADRSASLLASSTASVSVLRAEEVRRLPGVRGLADALRLSPGFAFLNLDGLGYDPQATVRGFYGGGEAEYVVVLLDGQPLNNVETGQVNWNQIPLSGIASIEVMRGGASSLYGDAAIGGVINVVTAKEAAPSTRWTVAGGTHGSFLGQAAVNGSWNGRAVSIFGDVQRTDGYRDHGERTTGSVGASLDLLSRPDHTLTVSALTHWRGFDDPGPLTTAELTTSRTQGAPFYRFDNTDEQTYRLALDGSTMLRPSAQLSGSVTGEYRSVDVVRTLPLSAEFADTKNRVIDATRLIGSAQLTVESLLSLDDKLILGADASLNRLDTEYYAVVFGDAGVYRDASGQRGDLDTKGEGRRNAVAAFVQYDVRPIPRVRLSLGSRLDVIDDSFEPSAPSQGERSSATHSAFSPKAGINVRYAGSVRHVGHWYANVSRSFKTATLDQLYDQRTIPVPFPPFAISISNSELDPQRGTSVETGIYHRADFAPGRLTGELSLSLYQMDMTDELDFNIETFSYVNIGKSRHRGVEAGAKLYVQDRATIFFNYTLQNVTSRFGGFEGKYVKAIPRDFISAGLNASHASGLGGSFTVNAARRIFLDDANTITLPNYTTADARLAYERRPFTLALDIFNLFDETYSTTGFPDPAGSDVVFFYPAAGRTLRLGLSVTL